MQPSEKIVYNFGDESLPNTPILSTENIPTSNEQNTLKIINDLRIAGNHFVVRHFISLLFNYKTVCVDVIDHVTDCC